MFGEAARASEEVAMERLEKERFELYLTHDWKQCLLKAEGRVIPVRAIEVSQEPNTWALLSIETRMRPPEKVEIHDCLEVSKESEEYAGQKVWLDLVMEPEFHNSYVAVNSVVVPCVSAKTRLKVPDGVWVELSLLGDLVGEDGEIDKRLVEGRLVGADK